MICRLPSAAQEHISGIGLIIEDYQKICCRWTLPLPLLPSLPVTRMSAGFIRVFGVTLSLDQLSGRPSSRRRYHGTRVEPKIRLRLSPSVYTRVQLEHTEIHQKVPLVRAKA